MDINIAEVINIVKTTKNNIDREDRLKKYFEALACEMVSKALEEIDWELAAQYGKDGWQVERRDCRTLQTTYGTICIKRRRMRKDGEVGIYPLDKELGIHRYQRYSAYFEYHVAQIAAKTVYRTTVLAIKGQKGKQIEVYRFQIAEGVVEHRKRRELVGTHYISDFEHKKAVKAMMEYLSMLDTVLSKAQDESQSENTERLRDYVHRNWKYLQNMKQRGMENYVKLIGTCESNHRLYSYRMKKQGCRWGKTGGLGMVKILTGIKNDDLRDALAAREEYFEHEPSENFRGAVWQALKKAKQHPHEGVTHGHIYLDAPSSSPLGKLAKAIA